MKKMTKDNVPMAVRVILYAKQMSPLHLKVLRALGRNDDNDFPYCCFATLMRRTGLPRKTVRRYCRNLRQKGLAQYANGLWNYAGAVAGAGYALTTEGRAVLRLMEHKPKRTRKVLNEEITVK